MEGNEIKPPHPKRNFAELEKRRLIAAKMFAKGASQIEIAEKLAVSRQAVHVWYAKWNSGGDKALAATDHAGRKPRLSKTQLKIVEEALLKGPRAHDFDADIWNLNQIAEVIKKVTGIEYHSGHVWRLMKALEWSAQKEQPSLKRKHHASTRFWKSQTWPPAEKRRI